MKQAGDHVPTPRKPRAPRKSKHVVSINDHHPSPSSTSTHQSTVDPRDRVEMDEPKAINLHDEGTGGMDTPSPGPVEPHSALVQSLFQVQAQSLNLVDPVQQAWNFVAAMNPSADHHHQQQQQQQQQLHQHSSQQQQQRGFGNPSLSSLGHLGVVLPGHSTSGFKIQQAYHPHPQQQQQQQQHPQNLNIIRNPNPGQGGPFVPTQFHDPNFRHFPN